MMIIAMIVLLGIAVVAAAAIPLITLTVSVFADNIQGTSSNDTLNGTPESDIINGFEGDDKVFGQDNVDILDGGNGNDEIYGGDGNDEIKDGNDDDALMDEADYGNKVYGGSGNDHIEVGVDYTRDDFYYLYGEDGSDYIKAVSNADIKGGLGDDTIYCAGYECAVTGDEGNDQIHVQIYDIGSSVNGGKGNDRVFGKGYDVNGDEGNDYLSLDSAVDLKGDEGDDVLEVLAPSEESYYNGGPGADIFNCSPGPRDIVEDYNPEEGDTISADCETVEGNTNNNNA
jgi:Ca2+-binding RTX toxin-like protein